MQKLLAVCGLIATFSTATVLARDLDGRWAQSPLKPWFDSLRSKGGSNCCSDADGVKIDDPDWEIGQKGYRVRLDGKWFDVPDQAIVTDNNRVGIAMVWPLYRFSEGDGSRVVTEIRCFMPGSGA